MKWRRDGRNRKGAVLVVALVALSAMFAFAALAIDLGYLLNTRSETNRCADAAALAACWQYIDELEDGATESAAKAAARAEAASLAGFNKIGEVASPLINTDDTVGDVRIGYLDLDNRAATLDVGSSNPLNAVEVTVRRQSGWNGPVPTFFARIFGVDQQDVTASATAAIARQIAGFEIPNDNSNLGILPFALDLETWNAMVAGSTYDNWTWNEATEAYSAGSDGVPEGNLYPQDTGAPGNRGTVDIGSNNNSTDDIARQILHGVSPSDLAFHGGKLEFGPDGTLTLNGDTGISAGVMDELASIRGQPKIIPIFSTVQGPGNNAQFTIVRWAGVRILDVKLTGSNSTKRVIIQPASVIAKGVIPSDDANDSQFVYSTVVLAR
jgi:Flp pilus assembly protein TadG